MLPPGASPVWLRISAHAVAADEVESREWLLVAQDVTATRRIRRQLERRTELLEWVKNFGRLSVWEREIPSGVGHWDE
jgi:hypothetical protein